MRTFKVASEVLHDPNNHALDDLFKLAAEWAARNRSLVNSAERVEAELTYFGGWQLEMKVFKKADTK